MAGNSFLQSVRSSKGADDFYRLSRAMKDAGQGQLRKELNKGMRDVAKPLIPKVRQAARDKLPHRGGLNARVARKPFRAAVRTGAQTAGVRIVGSKVDPRINDGRVFHPVFGRKPGVVQNVPGAVGYFDQTIRDSAPEVRAELENTLRSFKERLIQQAR